MKKILIILFCIVLWFFLVVGIGLAIKKGNTSTSNPGVISTETNTDISLTQITELNKKIDEYAKEISTLKSYISELEQSEEDNQVIIDGLEEVITNKTNELESLRSELATLQEAYDKLQQDYNELEEAYSSSQLDTQTLLGLYDGSVEELVVPEGVTHIRPYAFYGLSINSITLPNSICSLGERAFSNFSCSSFELNSIEELVVDSSCFQTSKINNFYINSTSSLVAKQNSFYSMSGTSFNISVDGTLLLEYSSMDLNYFNVNIFANMINTNGNTSIGSTYSSCKVFKIDCNQLLINNVAGLNSLPNNFELNVYNDIVINTSSWYLPKSLNYYGLNKNIFKNKELVVMFTDSCFNNFSNIVIHISSPIKYQVGSLKLNGNFYYENSKVINSTKGLPMLDFVYDDTNSVVTDNSYVNRVKKIINRSENYSNNFLYMLSDVTEEVYVADELYDQYIADENYSAYADKFHKLSELDTVAEAA